MNFLKNKRGAELTLNVIIIAAIALIVLVVIVFIFSGRISLFRQGTDSCSNLGGSCLIAGPNSISGCETLGNCKCADDSSIYIKGTDCEKQSKICCKKI